MDYREIIIPGDKSISHRAIMLAAISKGVVEINNILVSEDVMRTIACFREMGVRIDLDEKNKICLVYGVGKFGLKAPKKPLDCGNSGTTMRLMAGILIGQEFDAILIGDKSLSKRPMKRIIEPLTLMGGRIYSKDNNRPPLYIKAGGQIRSIDYEMKVGSAQVKSAILLADIYSNSKSRVREKVVTRDHTERMLKYFRDKAWMVNKLIIPSDISSAAYFIVKSLIDKDYNILIRNLGLNETRTGILDILKEIGGEVEIKNRRLVNNEDIGDLYSSYSQLRPFEIKGEIIGRLIDEIPILAVLAAFIEGDSLVLGAGELRVKETDRIRAICHNLKEFNAQVTEYEDGFRVKGGSRLKEAKVSSFEDHRIYMAFEIMASIVGGESKVFGEEAANISFPNFKSLLLNQSIG